MVVIFMMNLLKCFNHLILFCNLYRHIDISYFSYKVTLYQIIFLLFVINLNANLFIHLLLV